MSTPLRLGVLGSCVGRDMAELYPECRVVFYVARQSWISATSPPVEGVSSIELPSAFQRRMVAGDLASNALDVIGRHAHDLDALVIDLVDERLGVVPLVGGGFATDSQELKESGLKELLQASSPDLELGDDDHFDLWARAAHRVADRLRELELLDRSVVLRTPFASTTRHGVAVSPFMQVEADDWNEAYERYFATLTELGFTVVSLPQDLALGDEGHRWGLSPYHYVEDAYAWLISEVRRVVGRDDSPAVSASQRAVRVPLSLPVVGIANPATSGTVRLPLALGVDVHRWRLHMTNLDRRTDRLADGDVEITGLWVGREGSSPGSLAESTRRMGRRRVPRSRTGLVTPWFEDPIGDGSWVLSVGWRAKPGRPTVVTVADSFRSPHADAASGLDTSGFLPARYVPLSWTLEVETDRSVPIIVGWGDERCLSGRPGAELRASPVAQRARDVGGLAVLAVYPGTGLALWANYRRQWETGWAAAENVEVMHAMGARDAATGASLVQLRELFTESVLRVRAHFGSRVSAVLLDEPKHAAEVPATVRAYNDWMVQHFDGPVYRLANGSFVPVRGPLPAIPITRGLTS